MFKGLILNSCQRKVNRIKPAVNINLHKDMPTPSLSEAAALAKMVAQVNTYEEELKTKPDSFFKEKTAEYRKLISEKTKNLNKEEFKEAITGVLEEILPYYYAMVREAGVRTVKMRHFDVQILGGIVLHRNKIAEMTTGEGKTLVATLPAALNAIVGRGVHVVTVNDYLAARDCEWMTPIYNFLGFTCGVIKQDMDKNQRKYAYGCDITYGTNNEFGFDYLRDNMVVSLDEMVQRGHFFAIVDEVDSILVDEARTPLIISGPAELSVDKYYKADRVARSLKTKTLIQSFDSKDGTMVIKNVDGSEVRTTHEEIEGQFDAIVEEKSNNAYLTPRGEKKCEEMLGISSVSEDTPDASSNSWVHYLTQALRAHNFFVKDKEYIAKDGHVVIVDEFTGRLMPGRRWSDGLHQAVEAKEGLRIQEESQTLATITLQNYFRMYIKLAGMTGTAYTEANEFNHIYKLDVTVIPTNQPLIRANEPDRIYKNKKAKFDAVIAEVEDCYKRKQPVLVGTTSIEDSEILAFLLSKKGVPHSVLNAKYHEKEAQIVAQAGRLAQVTIATNMAGRGTDIVLGGSIDAFIKDLLHKNEITIAHPDYKEEYEKLYLKHKDKFKEEHNKVVELGGLHIVGTQRHEARRIDNQLRGRSARQGDPGSARFYVSLEDDLMRLFGSERIFMIMERFGFPEDEAIEHPLINRSMEIAQKRVEGRNFEVRKQLLDYDNVSNKQREVIYGQRREVLENSDIHAMIMDISHEVVETSLPVYFTDEPNTLGLTMWLKQKFDLEVEPVQVANLTLEEAVQFVKDAVDKLAVTREQTLDVEELRRMERSLALWVIDSRWKEHLLIMDSLKEGVHLRGYAQTDPLVEYQKESFSAFTDMIARIKEGIVDLVFRTRVSERKEMSVFEQTPQSYVHSEYSALKPQEEAAAKPATIVNTQDKAGRNEPCPCGSGKKYKKCCGK